MVQVPPAFAQSQDSFLLPQPATGKVGGAGKAQKGQTIESEDQSAKQLEKLQQVAERLHTTDEHANSISSGSSIGSIRMFSSPSNEIIDEAMTRSMAKYPGSQRDALNGFHKDISRMTQDQLDDMKDTIVKRMSSDESSQWDRDLLQKMYEITDAVSEHRSPPHVGGKEPWGPINIKPGIGEPPYPIKPIHPIHPHEKDPFIQIFEGSKGSGPINKLED